MQVTIIVPAIRGHFDADPEHKPQIFEGHLNGAEVAEIAKKWGSEYASVHVSDFAGDDEPAYGVFFLNDGDDPDDEDVFGDLQLWVYHQTLS